MKKKLVLIIAIVLVAVTACVMLVGCAPKNPSDFMEKWLNSNSKSFKLGEMEVSIYGNISYGVSKIGDNEYISYTEIDGDNVITYSGVTVDGKTTWTKKTVTKAAMKEMLGLDKDFESLNDILMQQTGVSADDLKDFEEKSTKKDGVYVGNEDTDWEGITIKLSSKEMVITEGEGEGARVYTFTIGAKKITIPQEAKDAKEM